MSEIGCEPLIRDRLLALTGVTDVVGTRIGIDEVSPGKADYPHIVIELSQEEPIEELDQYGHGYLDADIEVRCVARSYGAARELEWLTRHGTLVISDPSDGLVDWSGTIGDRSCEDVTYLGSVVATDYPESGEEASIHEHIGRYRVRYQQPRRA